MSRLPHDLLQELLVTFQGEAKERLEAANRAMLALEEASDPERVRDLVADLFREVHSLKGASAAVGLTEIQEHSHRLEDLLEKARAGRPLAPEHNELIYKTLDAISLLVDAPAREDRGAEPEGRGDVRSEPEAPEARGSVEDEPAARPERAHRISDDTVRVATSKLDALMGQVGELMVATSGTSRRAKEVAGLHEDVLAWERRWREARPRYRKLMANLSEANGNGVLLSSASAKELRDLLSFVHDSDSHEQAIARGLTELRRAVGSDIRRVSQVVTALQDEVRRTRMLPISSVFSTFPRVVRDIARTLNKEVTLEVDGGEIEVDRSVLENLKDPINHLLRNAIDHGLEDPEARVRSGKPRRGRIRMRATQKGDAIEVEIADDGAGLDIRRIKTIAVKKGVVPDDAAEAMSDQEAVELIFRSGFSTSPLITDVSGRGVGLDVVRDSVERINGLIEVSSEPGAGSSFMITVPLSIATTQCLIVRAGDGHFALPVTNVARIQRVDPEIVGRAEGRDAIVVDDRPIPLVRLADVLGVGGGEPQGDRMQALVVGSAEKRTAFVVDGFEGAQEVVIKALPEPLRRVRFAAGATITGSGDVVVILNVGDLTRAVEGGVVSGVERHGAHTKVAAERSVVLIADDSIVTRTLEKNILEAAGYDVRVASDGIEAWNVLESMGADVLVSDIEMPQLDGFSLTEKVRADERFATLPVVLVTSLDSRQHRERGIAVGADAHIVKQSFNQDRLLDTIRSLI